MPASFESRIAEYTRRVGMCLENTLPAASETPARLHEAMRYAVLDGGKRIRPLLVYASGECLDVEASSLDTPAAAIELIHAFSLVHDDLPAMDNDDLRRGKPTLHKAFDEETAILAGDAMQPLAFELIAQANGISAEQKVRLSFLIANACGSLGMTGGQSIDLASEGETLDRPALEQMYALKTGALLRAAIMSACVLSPDAPEEEVESLEAFASAIGVAFQIRDDILDVEGATEVIGKPAGSDVELGKATYPRLFGMDAARHRCDELMASAYNKLAVFSDRADSLRWLAGYIVNRGN